MASAFHASWGALDEDSLVQSCAAQTARKKQKAFRRLLGSIQPPIVLFLYFVLQKHVFGNPCSSS